MNEAYLRAAVSRTFDKVAGSAAFVALFTEAYQRDPTALMELGMALVLDKPVYLLVQAGTPIPDNLRRLARAIEAFSAADDVELATRRLLQRIEAGA